MKTGWFCLAHSLGYLLVRIDEADRSRAVDRIRHLIAARPVTALLTERLDLATGGAAALRRFLDDPKTRLEYSFDSPEARRSHQLGRARRLFDFCEDPVLVREIALADRSGWLGVRAIWLGGPSLLDGFERRLRGAPGWMLNALVEELGIVRHPGVVAVVAAIAASRASAPTALAWVAKHREFALPHIKALATTKGKTAKGAAIALADCKKSKPRKTTRTQKPSNLHAELTKVAKTFIARMKSVRGTEDEERDALEAAVDAYVEARTTAEEPIPSAYAGHFLMVDSHGNAPPPFETLRVTDVERDRWSGMLEDILDEYG